MMIMSNLGHLIGQNVESMESQEKLRWLVHTRYASGCRMMMPRHLHTGQEFRQTCTIRTLYDNDT